MTPTVDHHERTSHGARGDAVVHVACPGRADRDVIGALQAIAAPGDVDTTFGHDGIAVLGGITYPWAGAVDFGFQRNGRIVYASTTSSRSGSVFTVNRLRADGRPDHGFGNGGRITIPFHHSDGELCTEGLNLGSTKQPFVDALAITPSGGIVVAGRGCGKEIALAKLHHDGSLDSTFGDRGVVRTPVRGLRTAADLVLASGGGLGVVGGNGSRDVVVARYRPNGALDTRFAHDGIRVLGVPGDAVAQAATIQPDGQIVFGGYSILTFANEDVQPFVGRLGPNGGRLDQTFGTGGTAFVSDLGFPGSFADLALQADGSIVAVGTNNTRGPFVVARFSATGEIENLRTPKLGQSPRSLGVAISPSGEIFVGGMVDDPPDRTGFVAAAFGPKGWPDSSLGDGGGVSVPAERTTCCRAAVSLDTDGRIVIDGAAAFLRLLAA